MVRRINTKGIVILLMLMAALADASSTFVHNNESIFLSNNISSLVINDHTEKINNQNTGLCNPRHANIAQEFNRPNVKLAETIAGYKKAKILPKIARAFLLVLTGFVYISIIKDRKLWLATIYGLILAGQTGSNILQKYATRKGLSYFIHIKNFLAFRYRKHFHKLKMLYFANYTRGPPNHT